jgi:hypothetical protein
MTLTVGLLITAPARHRLISHRSIDRVLLRLTNSCAAAALLPFSLSLAIDLYIVLARAFGEGIAALVAALFWGTALLFWYGLEHFWRDRTLVNTAMSHTVAKGVSLSDRIDQMLTEARVILPGAQAMLGFQLLAMMSETFDRLPQFSKIIHASALACVALTVICLIAPAAVHRLSFNGADSERFYRIGSRFVTFGLLPLALGMAGDIYVAITKMLDSAQWGTVGACVALITLLVLWYAYPLSLRRKGTVPRHLQSDHSTQQ